MGYARFTMSGPFHAFLETIDTEFDEDNRPHLICSECGTIICEVEGMDSLGLLVRTALAHDEECEARVQPEDEPEEASDVAG